mgnify:CR=1 FL=1
MYFWREWKSYWRNFILDSNLKPKIINISDKNIVKGISSQLFEVAIHRVKREFTEVHKNNNFKFLGESEKGMTIEVLGKNQGDKYIVSDNKINMVFRKIHGIKFIHIQIMLIWDNFLGLTFCLNVYSFDNDILLILFKSID